MRSPLAGRETQGPDTVQLRTSRCHCGERGQEQGRRLAMCVACTHTIHRAQHHFGWNRDFAPALTCQARSRRSTSNAWIPPAASLGAGRDARDAGRARFRQDQSGHRPGLCRGRRARRCAEGDDPPFDSLGLSAGPPIFRASGCSPTSSRNRRCHVWSYDPYEHGAVALRARRQGAAEAVHRHDRRCAGRAGPAFGRAAAPRRRQSRHPRPDDRA